MTMRSKLLIGLAMLTGLGCMLPKPPKPTSRVIPQQLTSAPPVVNVNTNRVLLANVGKLKLSASTAYGGWPVDHLVDGKPETAWFSSSGDSAALGKTPWIQIELPAETAVKHVSVLGNRDPSFLTGYTVIRGKLQMYDGGGKEVYSQEAECGDNFRDFEFVLSAPAQVKRIRFTSLEDQGDVNNYQDIALGEVQVE